MQELVVDRTGQIRIGRLGLLDVFGGDIGLPLRLKGGEVGSDHVEVAVGVDHGAVGDFVLADGDLKGTGDTGQLGDALTRRVWVVVQRAVADVVTCDRRSGSDIAVKACKVYAPGT